MEQTFQVDYTTPIGKLHTIETGVKYIFRRNSRDNKFYEAAGGSNDYAYNEDRSTSAELTMISNNSFIFSYPLFPEHMEFPQEAQPPLQSGLLGSMPRFAAPILNLF